jgi:hypothetical protein
MERHAKPYSQNHNASILFVIQPIVFLAYQIDIIEAIVEGSSNEIATECATCFLAYGLGH